MKNVQDNYGLSFIIRIVGRTIGPRHDLRVDVNFGSLRKEQFENQSWYTWLFGEILEELKQYLALVL